MKKLIAILTLIAVTFMFTACDLSSLFDFSTQAPSTTPESHDATEAPDVTEGPFISPPPSMPPATEEPATGAPEPDYMKEFFDSHKGYWTEEGGEFISFSEEDGKYYAMFAIWNAGGQFPAGQVTKVSKAGDGLYFLTCELTTADGWKKEATFSIIDNADTDPRSIDTATPVDAVQKRYYYHTDFAYPSFFTERKIADFVDKYAGFWTAIDGNFIEITKNGDIFFAVWNAGGPFPGGKISDVQKVGDQYNVTVDISAVEPNDENSGWAAYTFYLSFEDLNANPESALCNHPFEIGSKRFYRHSEAGMPTFFSEMLIEEFVQQYQGYWTDMDGKFFYIGSDRSMSFAIWNAGGPFPAGKIRYATKDEDTGTYYITVGIPAMAANDENDG
ncbi:MAG: hypothetical protein J5912_00535, partial [Clostridia bacterium]|nr:hypothetical protein [Clostridia bacterium]